MTRLKVQFCSVNNERFKHSLVETIRTVLLLLSTDKCRRICIETKSLEHPIRTVHGLANPQFLTIQTTCCSPSRNLPTFHRKTDKLNSSRALFSNLLLSFFCFSAHLSLSSIILCVPREIDQLIHYYYSARMSYYVNLLIRLRKINLIN